MMTMLSVHRLLKRKAHGKFSFNDEAVTIRFYYFASSTNAQSAFRCSATGSAFGVIGAAIASSTQNNQSGFGVARI
jgi:hypothetical protein